MSETTLLKISYLAGVVLLTVIRRPHQRQWRSNVFRDDRMGRSDRMQQDDRVHRSMSRGQAFHRHVLTTHKRTTP